MFGEWFYNERVRKSVAIFGSLFDNLYVVRKSGSTTYSQMKVPLSYGPSRKFLERIAQMDNGEEAERQIAIKLPRMSFEITSIAYDATRQLPKTNSFKRLISDDSSKQARYYIGVPYIISFQLSVYAKSQDDALQVVEQIIPYFNPQYTVSVKPFGDTSDIVEDVPIILSSVGMQDDYEGDMANRRTIIYTLDFEMKVSFYGPEDKSGSSVIKQVDTNLFNMDIGLADSDVFVEGVTVTIDPLSASADSDYTYVSDIYNTERPE